MTVVQGLGARSAYQAALCTHESAVSTRNSEIGRLRKVNGRAREVIEDIHQQITKTREVRRLAEEEFLAFERDILVKIEQMRAKALPAAEAARRRKQEIYARGELKFSSAELPRWEQKIRNRIAAWIAYKRQESLRDVPPLPGAMCDFAVDNCGMRGIGSAIVGRCRQALQCVKGDGDAMQGVLKTAHLKAGPHSISVKGQAIYGDAMLYVGKLAQARHLVWGPAKPETGAPLKVENRGVDCEFIVPEEGEYEVGVLFAGNEEKGAFTLDWMQVEPSILHHRSVDFTKGAGGNVFSVLDAALEFPLKKGDPLICANSGFPESGVALDVHLSPNQKYEFTVHGLAEPGVQACLFVSSSKERVIWANTPFEARLQNELAPHTVSFTTPSEEDVYRLGVLFQSACMGERVFIYSFYVVKDNDPEPIGGVYDFREGNRLGFSSFDNSEVSVGDRTLSCKNPADGEALVGIYRDVALLSGRPHQLIADGDGGAKILVYNKAHQLVSSEMGNSVALPRGSGQVKTVFEVPKSEESVEIFRVAVLFSRPREKERFHLAYLAIGPLNAGPAIHKFQGRKILHAPRPTIGGIGKMLPKNGASIEISPVGSSIYRSSKTGLAAAEKIDLIPGRKHKIEIKGVFEEGARLFIVPEGKGKNQAPPLEFPKGVQEVVSCEFTPPNQEEAVSKHLVGIYTDRPNVSFQINRMAVFPIGPEYKSNEKYLGIFPVNEERIL